MTQVIIGDLINFKIYGPGNVPCEECESGLIVDIRLPANLSSALWKIEQYPCYGILWHEAIVWLSFEEIKYTSAAFWKQLKE